uniref:Uncharacterized protein n=1 Tax=Anguilla anguilla TaxID=7936 RepID=A0A0E9S3E1_ANGAN
MIYIELWQNKGFPRFFGDGIVNRDLNYMKDTQKGKKEAFFYLVLYECNSCCLFLILLTRNLLSAGLPVN